MYNKQILFMIIRIIDDNQDAQETRPLFLKKSLSSEYTLAKPIDLSRG